MSFFNAIFSLVFDNDCVRFRYNCVGVLYIIGEYIKGCATCLQRKVSTNIFLKLKNNRKQRKRICNFKYPHNTKFKIVTAFVKC